MRAAEAAQLVERGDALREERKFREALAMRRRLAGGENDPVVALCLAALAKMLDAVGRQHEAVALLEEALASYRRLHVLPWGSCFAGARSAIGSLWRVDDESTALLMAGFYRRLLAKDGADACGALHEARRALRRSHPEPYYWAPFVFVGAP